MSRIRKSNREYQNRDSNGNYVESLVYLDRDDWVSDIVPKKKGTIRILTYNVHGFYTRGFTKSADQILEVVQTVNPDLLVIQEFVLFNTRKQVKYTDLIRLLKGMGFKTIVTDELNNNVVASKFEAEAEPTLQLGRDPNQGVRRFANIMRIPAEKLRTNNTRDLIFTGTHLDVYDETGKTRSEQATKIIDGIEDLRARIFVQNPDTEDPAIVIAGDFNCLRPDDYNQEEWDHICTVDQERGVDTRRMKSDKNQKIDAVQVFEKSNLIDASVSLGSSIVASVWSNRRVDYILGRNIEFLGSRPIRNASSDHYPVYADFTINVRESSGL